MIKIAKSRRSKKESQGSCPVDNVNVFSQGLGDSGCQIFFWLFKEFRCKGYE